MTAGPQIALIGSRRGESSTSLRFPGSSDWFLPQISGHFSQELGPADFRAPLNPRCTLLMPSVRL